MSPINFRMPVELRARVRQFARDRHVGEADALRVIVSEHLDEIERERELAEAERWQLAQVYATLRRRNPRQPFSHAEMDRLFARAVEAAQAKRRA